MKPASDLPWLNGQELKMSTLTAANIITKVFNIEILDFRDTQLGQWLKPPSSRLP